MMRLRACGTPLVLALVMLAGVFSGTRLAAQFEDHPYPWQWREIQVQVQECVQWAQAFQEHDTGPLDPRRWTPGQFEVSRELRVLVAHLTVDLRHLAALVELRRMRGWSGVAARLVREEITRDANRLGELWSAHRQEQYVLIPEQPARQALVGLLGVLSHPRGAPGLCDWWSPDRNRVQGLFAELDPRTPHRREGGEWIVAPDTEIFLNTGYVLGNNRRHASSWGLTLSGVPAERQEGGFRLSALAPGRYRLELGRPGMAACGLALRIAWPRRLVLAAAGRGRRDPEPGGFGLRVTLEPGGEAATGAELRFELLRAMGAGDWGRMTNQPEPLRAPGLYRFRGLQPATYRVRVHAQGMRSSEFVEFRLEAATLGLRLVGRPQIAAGQTVALEVDTGGWGIDPGGVNLFVETGRGSDWRPLRRVVPRQRGQRFELAGLRPGNYRAQARDARLAIVSPWVTFEVITARPVRAWVPQRPANGWKKNPMFVQIPAGNWGRGEGLILLAGADPDRGRSPLAHRLALRAERDEPMVVDVIFVEGRDARGRRCAYSFFEPYIYDVSRLRNRGYAHFEYVTPRGRRQGAGVYLNHRVELPPPMPGLQWPPYAREFTNARRNMRHPERAYSGSGKEGKPNEGQNAILVVKRGQTREQGEIRLNFPQPILVERVRIRRFAPDATLLSIHAEVER